LREEDSALRLQRLRKSETVELAGHVVHAPKRDIGRRGEEMQLAVMRQE